MLIAHAPAGYLLANALGPRLGAGKSRVKSLLWTGVFFSVAPDLDLLWFYLVSDRTVHHHMYFPHWPLFWLVLAALSFLAARLLRKPGWVPYIVMGLSTALLHLALDTFNSAMYWLAPFSWQRTTFFEVPAVYGWWVWNFILNWTFLAEVAICLAALCVWRRSRSGPTAPAPAKTS